MALPPTAQGLAWLKVWQRLKHYHRPTHGMASIAHHGNTAYHWAMPTADLVHFSINHGK
ncbi:hypothetical protein NKT77_10065 [Moraxella sp. FZLJ2107]|uniref:hypothetical protein n=1 Tax=unclassified Moraxella TaxID=2685852 RepID=UPI0020C90BB2|nr:MULTISPECIES: hypothetical protein [unclassified Moraxella]UTO04776.1 hypothetical protein NKT77_09780 [Moraxella sp. FZLJ2107]UTO04809.1 hypothetical protein NKT77_09945 [Moraxella sp. FZLJ2107]UTO04821.1 hypothetical protein NKT77_10005 [Moraxella sp. FZLJ2107]UTO04833.1 hypothetical protein NKT77_10065 [Moraxella sp. FZLJ2107]UTO21499.1 hypothetical protein NKU06_06540 [Moraxella sp. FZLJ2109]